MKRTPIIRRTPLTPGTGLSRSTPMPKVNRKRNASAWARAYGSKARVRFVTLLPCAACGYAGTYPRQNAHTQNDGMGRKGGAATIIALCGPCHTKQHQSGWLAIGMTAESCRRAAKATEQAWQERGAHDLEDAA